MLTIGYKMGFMSEITRDRIEKALLEFTGFKGDQAVIDGLMVAIDAYAIALSHDLAGSSAAVRDSYTHLLFQQAELLLDSAGRLASAEYLATRVEEIAQLVATLRQDQLDLGSLMEDLRSDWARTRTLASIALDRGPLIKPEPVPLEKLEEWLAGDDLPDWERDLIERQYQERQDRIPGEPGAEGDTAHVSGMTSDVRGMEAPVSDMEAHDSALVAAALKAAEAVGLPKSRKPRKLATKVPFPFAGPGGDMYLQCRTCGLDLPVGQFFKNAKSPSGYESKCRPCRKAAKAA